jgi:hypothetical protein
MDGRSGLKSIEVFHKCVVEDVLCEEVIRVSLRAGQFKLINVTANSNGANAQES